MIWNQIFKKKIVHSMQFFEKPVLKTGFPAWILQSHRFRIHYIPTHLFLPQAIKSVLYHFFASNTNVHNVHMVFCIEKISCIYFIGRADQSRTMAGLAHQWNLYIWINCKWVSGTKKGITKFSIDFLSFHAYNLIRWSTFNFLQYRL